MVLEIKVTSSTFKKQCVVFKLLVYKKISCKDL